MKRWERKQRVKEIRLAQRAAKKQKREEAQATSADAAAAPKTPAIPSVPAETPASNDSGRDVRVPTLLPAYGVDDAVKEVAHATTETRNSLKQAKLVSEDEAAEMLSFAARQLSAVIDAGHRALSQVSPQRLKEATEVIDTPRMSDGTHATTQQRPRRGTDPVITLMKLLVSAVSLLQRVINRLHPKLRRAA